MVTTTTRAARLARGWKIPRPLRIVINAYLCVALLLALIATLAVALPAVFGNKTMVVYSGSMSPAIEVGDAVSIHHVDPATLSVGNVVTFKNPSGTGMITHRIVSLHTIKDTLYLRTKGDANQTPDPDLTPADAVYGKVRFTLPGIGYLLDFAAGAIGKVILIGLPLLVLVVKEVASLLVVTPTPDAPSP